MGRGESKVQRHERYLRSKQKNKSILNGDITTSDLIRLVAGDNSYALTEEYQKDLKEASRLFEEREKLQKEVSKLNDRIDNEIEIDPELGRSISAALGLYTEKGKLIKEKIDKKRAELNKVEEKWSKTTERIQKADREQRDIQKGVLDNMSLKPASQKSYKGFELDTHTPYLQERLQKGRAYIVEMTPKEYLQRVAFQVFNRSSLESAIRGTVPANVQKYAKQMRSGTKFYMPSLNLKDRQQEGRHRALAALMNGYKKIPVLVVL